MRLRRPINKLHPWLSNLDHTQISHFEPDRDRARLFLPRICQAALKFHF